MRSNCTSFILKKIENFIKTLCLKRSANPAILLRFAAAIYNAMKAHNIRSFRQLALAIDKMDVSELQYFGRGEREPGLGKIIAIADGIGITFGELGRYYDEVTDKDLQNTRLRLEKQSKKGRDQSRRVKPRKKKK